MESELLIRFEEASQAEANQYASELRKDLLDRELEGASVDILKENPNSMDFGATLAIILGSSSVIAIAKGIQVWLSKRPNANISISKTAPDGTNISISVVSNSSDLAKITEAIQMALNN